MFHSRAGTVLILSVLTILIGIACSLLLIGVMKVATLLRRVLWSNLPTQLGISADSPLWITAMLTATGIAVGLTVHYSPGHTGSDPATESLVGVPIVTGALPELLAVLILGLADGISLDPEHPIMVVNTALAIAVGSRLFPRVSSLDQTILTASGTIGTLFGTPMAAALVFSQTLNGSNESPLWDRLSAPLFAAAAGALTTRLFFHLHFTLPIPHYGQVYFVNIISGMVVTLTAIAVDAVAVQCLSRLHTPVHHLKNPILTLGTGGLLLGILGTIDGPLTLFKGLDEIQQLTLSRTLIAADFLLVALVKLAALALASTSDFHDGRVFPAAFVEVTLGLMLRAHVDAVLAAITVLCAILGMVLAITRGGWLNLFMAVVVVPDTTLLPLLCIVMFSAQLLLAGRPLMIARRAGD